VRQPRRLPESLEPEDVAAFVADLRSFRDRAITLLMLLGGLRATEVRSLRLADVDMGLRRVRVTGKGGKERVVPVDGRSSLSWPPTCARNARRRAGRRSASWCCAARPPGSR
jgi:site-specific recombinase XerC